ncbi:MAG: DHH family phosphoesterase, partial [Patescibacteria group bacterium]
MVIHKQKNIFREIAKEISRAKNILFLTHRAPDGDAVGSVLALNFYLKKKKKNTLLYILGAPHFLDFLPNFQDIRTKSPKKNNFDIVFALDYAGEERLQVPPGFSLDKSKVISIDHHPTGRRIGKIKLILSPVSSTCEILYYFFKSIKFNIDKNLATCLLVGMFTDTAGFAFMNRKSEKIASEIIKKGGELSRIVRRYNSFSLPRARLLAKMISRIKREKDTDILWSWLAFNDFREEKEKDFLQEPPTFPDFLSYIDRAKVHLFLIQYKNGKVKGSLRSRENVDVSKIAEKLGGGGHKSASGFKTSGTID